MGIFGRLFGSDEAHDNIMNKEKGLIAKAGGWIDRQEFTAEEKAEHYKELGQLRIKLLSALAPFKVVQRLIVFAVMGAWLFLIGNYVTAIWLENELAKQSLFDLMNTDYMTTFLYGVGFLYLGGGAIESFRRVKDS